MGTGRAAGLRGVGMPLGFAGARPASLPFPAGAVSASAAGARPGVVVRGRRRGDAVAADAMVCPPAGAGGPCGLEQGRDPALPPRRQGAALGVLTSREGLHDGWNGAPCLRAAAGIRTWWT